MERVMIAGTNSGCGKTTITCALIQALKDMDRDVRSFKCGPDYIDPMFHSCFLRVPSKNLDGYFCDDQTLRYLLSKDAKKDSIGIIEGVMGYYDGAASTLTASSYAVAKATETPVVLVIDCKGASISVAAMLHGFASFQKDAGICGVIFNRLPEKLYPQMAEYAKEQGIMPLGYFPQMKNAGFESRHLGLVTPAEITDIRQKLSYLSEQAKETIDLDALQELARSASELSCSRPANLTQIISGRQKNEGIRIAIARDEAFCFYYEDNLGLIQEMGFVSVPFSPLKDKHLPEDIHGLILGGGYPELYAKELMDNRELRSEIKAAVLSGLPTHAECGGHMYLHAKLADANNETYEMVGAIDAACQFTSRLSNFGYGTMTAMRDNLLAKKGEEIRVHEFHRSISDGECNGFLTKKGDKEWMSYIVSDTLASGFPHIHYYANLSFAANFARAVFAHKETNKDTLWQR